MLLCLLLRNKNSLNEEEPLKDVPLCEESLKQIEEVIERARAQSPPPRSKSNERRVPQESTEKVVSNRRNSATSNEGGYDKTILSTEEGRRKSTSSSAGGGETGSTSAERSRRKRTTSSGGGRGKGNTSAGRGRGKRSTSRGGGSTRGKRLPLLEEVVEKGRPLLKEVVEKGAPSAERGRGSRSISAGGGKGQLQEEGENPVAIKGGKGQLQEEEEHPVAVVGGKGQLQVEEEYPKAVIKGNNASHSSPRCPTDSLNTGKRQASRSRSRTVKERRTLKKIEIKYEIE
ncbi:unnamed protein product [Lepeophtheirus salmonis]|uniref:(salmon louse) hypothetical protein n=1 Tax=Lepeophtheirus salmonis TaxID=72036 RepID=A0A7R8H5B7_LEPSM|nr:unnamed protein product [Lepeophtheirus salmonis]CAF2860969.1 unnamed protein product [Lepeophtheirus salmonis]